jgi:hypothetical protein
LAQKLTQAEVPQSVLPDSVFKAVVKIPTTPAFKSWVLMAVRFPLQVGAVVMLPDGFTLAPQDRWTDEIKEETEGVYFSEYSDDQPNIILVGPIPGDEHQEIVFPCCLLTPRRIAASVLVSTPFTLVETAAAARCTQPVKRATTPSTRRRLQAL